MELNTLRAEIDRIDGELTALFLRRMEVSKQIAECKASQGLPVRNAQREAAVLDKVSADAPEELKASVRALYSEIMRLSREYQLNTHPELK